MDQKLKDYARLLARRGVNVQKGDEVWVEASLDHPEFVRLCVEELYNAGASYVEVHWSDSLVQKIKYQKEKLSQLSKIRSYQLARLKYRAKKLPSTLYIMGDDPNVMNGVNMKKVAKARMKTYPKIKPFRDAMDGKYKWCIAAVPNANWAKMVFPGESEEVAVAKLWDAILSTSRVDGNDPVKNWEDHNKKLKEKRAALESFGLVELRYKSSNGTDFKVGLDEYRVWGGGSEEVVGKGDFNPNIPSEEVFTSPVAGQAEGLLIASKPLSYNGALIEDFSIRFKDGKVCEVKAKKGQKILEQMVSMDEGASMLGECALIAYDSPIRETGLLFYNTLFDENAACHFALGAGFPDCIKGGLDMSHDELVSHKMNDSMIHVDFMVGTADLDVVGITKDGKEIQIFKDGNWAF
ncbi:MAG: aminopeptidase [Bacilli bacterium]|nr:aminopeptidase [Bacilli bacterium]